MRNTSGNFGPDSMLSCPNCGGDVILEGDAALGKVPMTHVSRIYFDPRMPNRTLTRICGASITFFSKKGYVEF
jgi:hypothetical protein